MIAEPKKSCSNTHLFKASLTFVPLMLLFCFASSNAQTKLHDGDLDWKLKRDRKGIQIFLSRVPGSKFRAVMSVMEVKATPRELTALIMDLDNCPKWASMCKSARVVEQVSDTENYVYSVNNAPFPVRSRDIVSLVKWNFDKVTGKVSMRSNAAPDKLPKKRGLVRVQYASSEWHFTPMSDGVVLVENYAHVDPNGKVPAWLTNLLIVESPYKTLKNMRKLVLNRNYRDAEVGFLHEDPSNDNRVLVDKKGSGAADIEAN